jgi:hypothetical protein
VINLAVAEYETVRPPQTPRDALTALLAELEALVLGIRTNQFAATAGARGTTVGREVARAAARIASLFDGAETGTIRYAPGSEHIAVDPVAALKKVRALRAACAGWPRTPLSTVVRVEHGAAGDADDAAWSTLGAEAAFVIGEIVDAQRSIAAALRALGADVPDGFGDTPVPALTARMSAPPVWALWKRLDEIAALLLEIPADVYTTPARGHVSGSLGAHVRHCLDHVSALLSVQPSTTLSYDGRRRGTPIESDPGAALQHILRLKAALERASSRSLDEPVRVASQIDASGASIVGWSTFGRELAFVLSHTVHHQATMAAVLALHGADAPDGFGYAPSTPRS